MLTELMLATPSWGVASQVVVSGIVMGSVFALIGVGFNLVHSATGVINFAQGEFLVLGGFVVYAFTALGVPVFLAITLAMLVVALIGCLVEVGPMRRAKGEGIIGRDAVTLGISMLIVAGTAYVWGVEPLPVPQTADGTALRLGELTVTRQQLCIVLAAAVAVVTLHLFLTRSNTGLMLRATAMNRQAAQGVGVAVGRVAMIAWALSGAVAALAGALVTPTTGVSYSAGFFFTLAGFSAAILGGIGSMPGAVLGGVTLGLIQSVASAYLAADLQDAAPMVVLLLIFALRPQGFLGRQVSRA